MADGAAPYGGRAAAAIDASAGDGVPNGGYAAVPDGYAAVPDVSYAAVPDAYLAALHDALGLSCLSVSCPPSGARAGFVAATAEALGR